MIVCSSGSSSRTCCTLARWSAFSQTTARAPEFPSTQAHSLGELVGYTGTTTPPATEMP